MKPSRKSIQNKITSERGQAVILISVVIASFVMFFGFAINTGVLITAKISVQAAADAAAYAGAATQARQMNAISYLNYDMRRQLKKFIYRYNFFGNLTSPNFPNAGGSNPNEYPYPRLYYDNNNVSSTSQLTANLNIPVVCIPISEKTRMNKVCQTLNTKDDEQMVSSFFNGIPLTGLSQALLAGVTGISQSMNTLCVQNGSINLYVLLSWLFRGTNDPSKATQHLTTIAPGLDISPSNSNSAYAQIQKTTEGLGLYPRNFINLMRIKTLETFLNERAKKEVDQEQVESMEKSQTAELSERTIQAFKSALVNLNSSVINHDSVIMSELQNDTQIRLLPIIPSFNAYVQFLVASAAASSNTCPSRILSFKVTKVPVGVRSDLTTPVHYAVKVTAKAKLLFLPSGTSELELNAVASAKPFGSRIGPKFTEADFVKAVPPPANPVTQTPINDCSNSLAGCNLAHLNLTPTISTLSPIFLKELHQLGVTPVGGSPQYNYKGLANAMAPNPTEVGRYNIIPPPPTNAAQMAFEYIPFAVDANSRIYRFYAPIYSMTGEDPGDTIKAFIEDILGGAQVSGNNEFEVDMTTIKDKLVADMVDYVKNVISGGSTNSFAENGESTTFAAIQLPMGPHPSPEPPVLQPSGNQIWLTKSNEVLSSWAPERARIDGNSYGLKPRFGYSVKFVAMQNLLQSGMNSSDPDQDQVSH